MTDKNEIDKKEEKAEESAEKVVKSLEDIHREMTLDFSKLSSETTIEDVQKEAQQIEDDNLSAESPLDKYVRQHREEVETVKVGFGKDLDELVNKERELLEKNESEESDKPIASEKSEKIEVNDEEIKDSLAVEKEEASESETPKVLTGKSEESLDGDMVDVSIFPAPTLKERNSSLAASPVRFDAVKTEDDMDQDADFVELKSRPNAAMSRSSKNNSNYIQAKPIGYSQRAEESDNEDLRKKIVIGIIILAVILSLFWIIIYSQTNKNPNNGGVADPDASSLVETTAEISKFTAAYNAFFTDNTHIAIKNSNFDKIGDLKKDLDAIPSSDSNFERLKMNYDNLSSDIEAIKAVNAIFDKPVIVDGKLDNTVTVKADAEIPTVSSKNSTLDALLTEAVNLANKQKGEASKKAESSAASSSAAAAENNAATNGTDASNATTTTPTEGVYSQNPSGAAVSNSGSRVPIQSIDPNDPAFAWGPGVLDYTIATMQSRGFISGNNYILLPAAIDTSGQGWYNIYSPGGGYLFSINCKTGFWAGTGGKHPNLGATFN